MGEIPENEVTYEGIAPLLSQYLTLAEIESLPKPVVKEVVPLTKAIIESVIALLVPIQIQDEEENIISYKYNNPSKIASQLGISKGQVVKIKKEYEAAQKFKLTQGEE